MVEGRDFFKKVAQIGGITLISRVLGLAREMIRAQFLGTSYFSDAFVLAFSLPNLFRRLTAEGAMSTAFIPVFCEVEQKEGKERALQFARNFFWALSLILVLFSSAFIYFADFFVAQIFARGFSGETLEITVWLTRLMFGYILLISLSSVAQGVLNARGLFNISSATPIALNLAIIACAYGLSPFFANPATPFALGVMLGGLLQLTMQFPALFAQGFHFFGPLRLWTIHIKEALFLMFPALFGAGIYQINILLSNLIATTLVVGSLSSLTFSNRLLELVLGIVVVSITTVTLPQLTQLFLSDQLEQAKAMLRQNVSLITLITLPVITITWVMAEEIIALLFLRGRFDQQSLMMTAGALKFHILGLVFIGVNRLLLSVFQAKKQIKTPVWISFWVMLANLAGCWFLAQSLGHRGIALANSLSQALQSLLLLFGLAGLGIRGWVNSGLLFRLLRQGLLALYLGVGLYWVKVWLCFEGVGLSARFFLLLAALGLLLFSALPILAKKELRELKSLLKKRRSQSP